MKQCHERNYCFDFEKPRIAAVIAFQGKVFVPPPLEEVAVVDLLECRITLSGDFQVNACRLGCFTIMA